LLLESLVNPDALLTRRRWLKSAALLPAVASGAAAAAWPDRPIRLIVPSAAGGSPDILCRILGAELARALGQAVVIDNKPGASGNIGMQEIVRAAPDGYTLGYGNVGTLAINQSLFANLPYQRDAQLVPVAMMGFVQNALVVRNDLPVDDVRQLITLARSRPGKLVMASAGNGTTGHLGGELFKSLTNTFILHVPYRGSPQAIQDLIGGQVDVMFDNLSSIGPHVRDKRVKALAVSGNKRSPAFPNLPTLAEAGVPGYAMAAWGGIVAPMGTPVDAVRRLNAEINRAQSLPAVAERYAALSFEPVNGPPQRLFEQARQEEPMWAEVIKRSGAKVD
jgi:tripartite-type tricarboxylate transporter receptor subunit TctC